MAIKIGTSGKDSITGTSKDDELKGLDGSDRIYANPGNDRVYGGAGEDGLYGQAGDDVIYGGSGIDALFGNAGNDQLYGEAGDDYMAGGDGSDYLHGGSGNDRLRGEAGNDTLNGGTGDNDVQGGSGNDILIHQARTADSVGGKAVYGGGEGIDTLLLDVQGTFPTESGDAAGIVGVYVNSDGSGIMDYITDPFEPFTLPVGKFSGIEVFQAHPDSNSLNFAASADAMVIGSNKGDVFTSREGSQDITAGTGKDLFRFSWQEGEDGGNDAIHGFSLAQGDRIQFRNNENGYEGPDLVTMTAEEKDGHTVYAATEISSGEVVYTVDVDAVGLPPIEYYF